MFIWQGAESRGAMDRIEELEEILSAYYLGSYSALTDREIGLLEDELHSLKDSNRETYSDGLKEATC